MNRHLTGVMAVALAVTVHITAPAFAGHRPGNVVVIGGTISETGRYVLPAGRIHSGRKLFWDELNARGGLLGHKVKLRIYDDKSDVRTAIELYQKLFTGGEVDLIMGPYGSHLTDPVANVMERYKQPFLAHGTNPLIWQRGRKYVFGYAAIGRDYQKGALHLAKRIGVKRIAMLTLTDLATRAFLVGAQEWAKTLGLTVVLSERYPKKQTDFTALLRRVEASGAEAIIANTRFHDSVAQSRQLRELKINVKMFAATIGPGLPKFVEELGNTAEYVVGFSQWEPKLALGYPGMKAFIENYEKRHGEKPNYHAADGYTSMQIFAAAVNKASSFVPEMTRDALASITVDTIRGRWTANEKGLGALGGLTFQIRNGKRVIVWPEDKAEAKVLLMPKWEDRAKK